MSINITLSGVFTVISLIAGTLLCIYAIYILINICKEIDKNLGKVKRKMDPPEKILITLGVITVGALLIASLFGDIDETNLGVKDKEEYYSSAIQYMSNADWYNATISFDRAGGYKDSYVLRDYCYYVYISESHPNWVPYMGINEITGG